MANQLFPLNAMSSSNQTYPNQIPITIIYCNFSFACSAEKKITKKRIKMSSLSSMRCVICSLSWLMIFIWSLETTAFVPVHRRTLRITPGFVGLGAFSSPVKFTAHFSVSNKNDGLATTTSLLERTTTNDATTIPTPKHQWHHHAMR